MFPSQPEFLQHILDECDFILQYANDKSEEAIVADETLNRGTNPQFGNHWRSRQEFRRRIEIKISSNLLERNCRHEG